MALSAPRISKKVAYCSKDCQAKDRKDHRQICKAALKDREAAITLEEPSQGYTFSISNQNGGESHTDGSFRKPDDIEVNEPFYVKVQGSDSNLLIYDRSRQCHFMYLPNQRGFQDLLKKVKSDPSANGRKTYMAASFDEEGKCKMYLNMTTIKTW